MIFSLIFGKVRISGNAADIFTVSDILIKNNISFYGLHSENGTAHFFCPIREKKKIDEIADNAKISLDSTVFGLPRFFSLYKKRTGMFVGLAICISLVLLSERYIWTVNITGNDAIAEKEIAEFLKREGIFPGAPKKGHKLSEIAMEAELEFEHLAWMAINIQGTEANVEIRERKIKPDETDMNICTNIVASCDGQIVYIQASSGKPEVKKYDVVTKGQLLIGGILDSKAFGYKKVRSVGKILAKTEHIYKATVPKTQLKKIYTGREKSAVTYEIFSKSFSFGKNKFSQYDTTYTEEKAKAFSSVCLPITVKRTVYREYRCVPEKIGKDDAVLLAMRQIGDDIEAELSGAEIVSKEKTITENEDSVTVEIKVNAIEDICSETLITD